jgi:hypothetical protein
LRERLQQARSAHQSELCNQLKVQEQRLRFELGKGWKAEKETLMAQHRVRASLSLSLSLPVPCRTLALLFSRWEKDSQRSVAGVART